MTARRSKERNPTAGERLISELSRDDDPFSVQFLIEQAGHIADYLDRSHGVLSGDRSAWLDVEIGAKTVAVQVTSVLVQHRQLVEQLRKLLSTIHSRRAEISDPDDELDVAADL